jgi:putative hemolysin
MKRIYAFILILITLTGCTVFQVQTSETTGTDMPQANIPNPAAVYCEQNGNKLEIQTAADGSNDFIAHKDS